MRTIGLFRYRVLLSVLALLAVPTAVAYAQDSLSYRLQQIPSCVGANQEVSMPYGDSWTDVGVQYHVGFQHLRRANPRGFGPGKTVLIPGRHIAEGMTRDGVVLNQPELMLYYWRDGRVVSWYPVSIGMMTSRWHTPLGKLHVVSRVMNPVWRRPPWAGGGIQAAGPKNPLGDRWLGLNRRGYGMHGTNASTSIGKTVSHGCIRLYPAHIHELFNQAWIGMPVYITYKTVMVGQDDGVIYLAVFPDIYSRGTNSVGQAKARLNMYGLGNAIPTDELRRRLARADGVARPILGSDVRMEVNDRDWFSSIRPTIRNGVSYLPARELINAIDGEIYWDEEAHKLSMMKNTKSIIYSKDSKETFNALDSTFVPIRSTVESLGGTVVFSKNLLKINMP